MLYVPDAHNPLSVRLSEIWPGRCLLSASLERGLSLEPTAECCGMVNSKTIARTIAAVLGVDSHAALALTMDEVVVRAYRYMLIDPDSHPALPPLPGRTDPSGSTSTQREKERAPEQAGGAP